VNLRFGQRPKLIRGELVCRTGGRRVHRELHDQIREGERLPELGSGHITGFLRLPCQALEAPADHQSH
jgi:hypothetical protein